MKIFGKSSGILSLSFALILVLWVLCFNVGAHDLWINVADYTPEVGQIIKGNLGYGHRFPEADFLHTKALDNLYLIDPADKAVKLKPINESEVEYNSAMSGFSKSEVAFQINKEDVQKQGTYLLVADRKPLFYPFRRIPTDKEHKFQSKKGLKYMKSCSLIQMCAKAILDIGPGDSGFSRVAAQALELVPLENPATLKEQGGDYLPVKVFFKGEPLTAHPSPMVYATYAGFSESGDWAFAGRTNNEGVVKIKIAEPGLWLIKVGHNVPHQEEFDHSYRATLVLEIK